MANDTNTPRVYDVHEGRPSWHQQRAGHISAGVTTGFKTRAEADAFVTRCKGFRPDTYIFVVERTATKQEQE